MHTAFLYKKSKLSTVLPIVLDTDQREASGTSSVAKCLSMISVDQEVNNIYPLYGRF
jgi:hypothetical protein